MRGSLRGSGGFSEGSDPMLMTLEDCWKENRNSYTKCSKSISSFESLGRSRVTHASGMGLPRSFFPFSGFFLFAFSLRGYSLALCASFVSFLENRGFWQRSQTLLFLVVCFPCFYREGARKGRSRRELLSISLTSPT